MNAENRPIIVGAGPVGLGAALFLALQGRSTYLIEQRLEPSRESRALAVNPRTLDILESTGVTQRMLEIGLPIHAAVLHRGDRVAARMSLDGIHPKYPFMLALSQATTERLLARALEAAGGAVERGIRMVECQNRGHEVEALLEPTGGGPRAIAAGPWLLAADGAHSTARSGLHIPFPGSAFPNDWYLADVPLRTALPANETHVFFPDGGGFLFLIRVVDDELKDRPGDPIWRVIGNRPDPLWRFQQGEATAAPLWESSFYISHRINQTLACRQVYFAGDAAHIHSPIGARGMNLGLEDAWVFAQLVLAGRLDQYDTLRWPVDCAVVRTVERFSKIVAGESPFFRFARSYLLPLLFSIPPVRKRFLRTATGLDHPLDALGEQPRTGVHARGAVRAQSPPVERSR
jgi:2-polyprenyl-6-methoxyphenol hydroxylase-like FAD-dependent oxidoreductase